MKSFFKLIIFSFFSLSVHAMKSGKELVLKSETEHLNCFELLPDELLLNVADKLDSKVWNAWLNTCKRFSIFTHIFLLKKQKEDITSDPVIFTAFELGAFSWLKNQLVNDPSLLALRNWDNKNLLHVAVNEGNYDIAKFLISLKSELINEEDKSLATPLFYSSMICDLCTKLLIENEAEINKKNNYGNTPLHMAAAARHKENIILLLNNGADKTIQNNYFHTALNIIERHNTGRTDLTNLFKN